MSKAWSRCCCPQAVLPRRVEITDVNRIYMERNQLFVEVMGRGFAWLDTGTHTSLLQASQYVELLEQRQGLRIACPEEIAFRLGYTSHDHFCNIARRCEKSGYGDYLLGLANSFKDSA